MTDEEAAEIAESVLRDHYTNNHALDNVALVTTTTRIRAMLMAAAKAGAEHGGRPF